MSSVDLEESLQTQEVLQKKIQLIERRLNLLEEMSCKPLNQKQNRALKEEIHLLFEENDHLKNEQKKLNYKFTGIQNLNNEALKEISKNIQLLSEEKRDYLSSINWREKMDNIYDAIFFFFFFFD